METGPRRLAAGARWCTKRLCLETRAEENNAITSLYLIGFSSFSQPEKHVIDNSVNKSPEISRNYFLSGTFKHFQNSKF